MTALSVTLEELDDLGRKLDAADLTEKEREVLATVFRMAAETISDEEVSGFSFSFGAPAGGGPMSLGGMFQNSFLSGPRSEDGEGPGQGGIHISSDFGTP